MANLDFKKFLLSWIKARCMMSDNETAFVIQALREQGMDYKDGKIVAVDIGAPEGDKSAEYTVSSDSVSFGLTEDCQRMVSAKAKEALYGKPSWSEVDEDLLFNTINNLIELKDRYGEGYGKVGKCIDWLKSLKERIE